MTDRKEVAKTIDEVVIPYVDCFAWEDFGSSGNPCYNPNAFASPAQAKDFAYTLAAVQLEMRKNGLRHTGLAGKVAAQTGNKYVTYPWLRDAVSRILSGTTYDELLTMAQFARAVKAGMQARGLKEIHSITEALS